jgi:hypothetical protein
MTNVLSAIRILRRDVQSLERAVENLIALRETVAKTESRSERAAVRRKIQVRHQRKRRDAATQYPTIL